MNDVALQERRVEVLLRRLGNPKRRRRWQSTLQVLGDLWDRRRRSSCLRRSLREWPKVAPTAEAIRTVGRCLDDPRPDVRIAVMYALRHSDPHVDEALPFLAAGLRDPHVPVRLNAITAIRAQAKEVAPLVPALRAAFADPVRTVRAGAAVALTVAAPSVELVPVLVEALRNGDAWLVVDCLAGLERLGPLAAPAVPSVLERLERGVGGALAEVLEGLHRLVGDADVPGLPRARLRSLLVAAPRLWAYRGSAEALTEAMLPFLSSEDSILRVHAVSRVREYDGPAPGLHARLTELLEDGSAFVRAEAAAYLAGIRADAPASS